MLVNPISSTEKRNPMAKKSYFGLMPSSVPMAKNSNNDYIELSKKNKFENRFFALVASLFLGTTGLVALSLNWDKLVSSKKLKLLRTN